MRPLEALKASQADPTRPATDVIVALGLAQIGAWGTSYYLPAVLAQPIAVETGWPLSLIVGGLSLGMVCGGISAPAIGRQIARHGGRPVLSAGALLLAAGLALLGVSRGMATYFLSWAFLGVGMACSLYDACFATLGTLYGTRARPAIAAVTLFGGFASTVFWPLSAWLSQHLGWRGTCLVYAGYHLCVTLPLIRLRLPRAEAGKVPPAPLAADAVPGAVPPDPPPAPLAYPTRSERLRIMIVLGATFTLTAFITASFAVHLLTLLQARGMELATAVALGATVGPSQVAGRAIEMAVGRNIHPVWTMAIAVCLIVGGLALVFIGMPLAAAGFVAYGAGIGVTSIARGATPLALFGAENYAVIVGRLAMPNLIAQAVAPLAIAALLTHAGANITLAFLFLTAAATLALSLLLIRLAKPGPQSFARRLS